MFLRDKHLKVFDPHCDIFIGFSKFGIQPLLPSPKPHTHKSWTSDEDKTGATSTATAAGVTETPTAWLFFAFTSRKLAMLEHNGISEKGENCQSL